MSDESFDVEVVQRVLAPREVVFSYFTDPGRMALWIGGRVTLDARPGGQYRIHMVDGPTTAGEYGEIDPPRRVVLTWGMEGNPSFPAGSTTVEVTLTEDGEGTIVRLRHRNLPDAEMRRRHTEGWTERLRQLAGNRFG